MKIYSNTDAVNADLRIGDLFKSKRGGHSILINIYETSFAILTEAGRCYTISREQINLYTRFANVDLRALRFDCVFDKEFVSEQVSKYYAEIGKRSMVAQLADIPAEVLEAALEARRNQNMIHSRSIKA